VVSVSDIVGAQSIEYGFGAPVVEARDDVKDGG